MLHEDKQFAIQADFKPACVMTTHGVFERLPFQERQLEIAKQHGAAVCATTALKFKRFVGKVYPRKWECQPETEQLAAAQIFLRSFFTRKVRDTALRLLQLFFPAVGVHADYLDCAAKAADSSEHLKSKFTLLEKSETAALACATQSLFQTPRSTRRECNSLKKTQTSRHDGAAWRGFSRLLARWAACLILALCPQSPLQQLIERRLNPGERADLGATFFARSSVKGVAVSQEVVCNLVPEKGPIKCFRRHCGFSL